MLLYGSRGKKEHTCSGRLESWHQGRVAWALWLFVTQPMPDFGRKGQTEGQTPDLSFLQHSSPLLQISFSQIQLEFSLEGSG